jgi:exopolysaccharide production protein ExoZ
MAKRLAGVEAGRGLAATLVVCDHTTSLFHGVLAPAPLWNAFSFGHAGVDFFFVLSGFIICHVHWNDIGRPEQVKSYLWKRFVRIYPTYWVALALFVLLFLISPEKGRPLSGDLLVSGFFLYPHLDDPILRAGWTLRHELLFYGLFAVVILNRRIGSALLLAWACCIVWNSATVLVTGDPYFTGLGAYVFFRIFNIEFFFGIGVAYLVHRSVCWRPLTALAVGSALFIATGMLEVFGPAVPIEWPPRHLGYAIGAALALYGAVTAENEGRLRVPEFLFRIGTCSYSIYLIHMLPVLILGFFAEQVARYVTVPSVLWFLVIVSVSVAVGMAFSQMIEQPILRKLRRGITGPVAAVGTHVAGGS